MIVAHWQSDALPTLLPSFLTSTYSSAALYGPPSPILCPGGVPGSLFVPYNAHVNATPARDYILFFMFGWVIEWQLLALAVGLKCMVKETNDAL